MSKSVGRKYTKAILEIKCSFFFLSNFHLILIAKDMEFNIKRAGFGLSQIQTGQLLQNLMSKEYLPAPFQTFLKMFYGGQPCSTKKLWQCIFISEGEL